jgi:hypothetical protein
VVERASYHPQPAAVSTAPTVANPISLAEAPGAVANLAGAASGSTGGNAYDMSAPPTGAHPTTGPANPALGVANPTGISGSPEGSVSGRAENGAGAGFNAAGASSPPAARPAGADAARVPVFANPTDMTDSPSAAAPGPSSIDLSAAAGTNAVDTSDSPGSTKSGDAAARVQGIANPTDIAESPLAFPAGANSIDLSQTAGANEADISGPPGSALSSSGIGEPGRIGANQADLSESPGDDTIANRAEREPADPADDLEGFNRADVSEGPATASPPRVPARDSSRSSRKSPKTK